MTPDLDPFLPQRLDDPFPAYRRLRDAPGLVHHPRLQMWMVARYQDCRAVLADDRFGKDYRNVEYRPAEDSAIGEARPDEQESATDRVTDPVTDAPIAPTLDALRSHWFLLRDPPEHTRLRAAVASAFGQRSVKPLRSWLETKAHQQLDRMETRFPAVDLVAEFTSPFPVAVVLDLLDLPTLDPALVVEWSDATLASTEVDGTIEHFRRAESATRRLQQALEDCAGRAKRAGTRMPVSEALDGARAAGELSDEERLSTLALLILGGYDTTGYALANGLRLILSDPALCELLHREPGRLPQAVEEILRIDPPLHRLSRVSLCDAEIAGQAIRQGEWLAVLLAAANHDPEVFDAPECFDIHRSPNPHLGLGVGRHYCLGAALVRLELEVALGAVLQRFPRLALGPEPPIRRRTAMFRGWSRLPARHPLGVRS